MAGLLDRLPLRWAGGTLVGCLFLLALVLGPVGARQASAQSQVTAPFTGYAMGNRYGSGGVEMDTGMFANHSPSYCPNDPAASWAYGSSITLVTPSTITTHSYNGGTASNSFLRLYDIGDLSCARANYWGDNYFGRFKPSADACSCLGSPSPGYCIDNINGYTGNSCTDATNWGNVSTTYWTP